LFDPGVLDRLLVGRLGVAEPGVPWLVLVGVVEVGASDLVADEDQQGLEEVPEPAARQRPVRIFRARGMKMAIRMSAATTSTSMNLVRWNV